MARYTTQTASNVQQDSLCVELLNENSDIVADVCRIDANNTLKINTFNNDLDVFIVEQLIQIARQRLGPFEDGTPIAEAVVSGSIV